MWIVVACVKKARIPLDNICFSIATDFSNCRKAAVAHTVHISNLLPIISFVNFLGEFSINCQILRSISKWENGTHMVNSWCLFKISIFSFVYVTDSIVSKLLFISILSITLVMTCDQKLWPQGHNFWSVWPRMLELGIEVVHPCLQTFKMFDKFKI